MPQIGPYTLHVIECGCFRLDGGSMFGIIPRVLWQRRISPDDRNRIQMTMRSLLLEGDGRLILIDNGAGNKYDRRFQDIYALEGCLLEDSLRKAGFGTDEVTDVILTHLHFDHAGGSTERSGTRIVPKFRNATYHLQQRHLEEAQNPNIREQASFFADNFEPLIAAGQLKTHLGESCIFPGVDLLVMNGHTTAQQLVKISGEAGTLVFCADLLPTVHHVRGSWIMAYDVQPLVTIQEKKSFLRKALRHQWQLFFEHDANVIIAGLCDTEKGIVADRFRPLGEIF